MIIFVPFEPGHIDLIRVQPEQKWELEAMPEAEREELVKHDSWSAFKDGECLGCGGVIDFAPSWPHRALAWALVGNEIGLDMVQIVRFIRGYIAAYPAERVEAVVDCDFINGHRFAEMLGFKLEAPRMVKYGHGGRDMALYARVN